MSCLSSRGLAASTTLSTATETCAGSMYHRGSLGGNYPTMPPLTLTCLRKPFRIRPDGTVGGQHKQAGSQRRQLWPQCQLYTIAYRPCPQRVLHYMNSLMLISTRHCHGSTVLRNRWPSCVYVWDSGHCSGLAMCVVDT